MHDRPFDPDATLRTVVEEAASPEGLADSLRDSLETLGGFIFGWLVRQLKSRRVADPDIEAQDLFQGFCVKVYTWIRPRGADVGAPWFWRVARNTFINYLRRELQKKREPEQPLDWEAEETAWLAKRLNGCGVVEARDSWTDARTDALLLRCIARLPKRHRQFLFFDLVGRLSGRELDEALGLQPKSRAALKAKVLRGLRAEIRRELKAGPGGGLT